MHKSTIILSIIKYYNYQEIYNPIEIHIFAIVFDTELLYENLCIFSISAEIIEYF